jgi:hypothetical protein
LAAWLNWCDSRFDNTRLVILHKRGDVQLRHYFTDLGGGLGEGTGFISRRGESPNDFAWSFTKPAKDQGPGRMRVPFKIVGYRPLDETPAFKEMTTDDARWMARLIGQLTETQLEQALIASGFDSAQVRLYTEKLISRRDRMIVDLGLKDEIPLLREGGPTRDLNYNPAVDGLIIARTGDGQFVEASPSPAVVVHGRVVPNPTEPASQLANRTFTPPAKGRQPMIAGLEGRN